MKKLFILAMAMLFSVVVIAQEKKTTPEKKGYFAFSGGLAIPVSDFSSTNLTNGGFAETGFNLNLHGGYNFAPRFALAGNMFYSTYAVNSEAVGVPGVKMDHWQYYGLALGPSISMVKTERFDFTVNLYAGLARANSPVISYETESTTDAWATAFTMQLGTQLRFMVTPKTFVLGGLDYTAMRPKWNEVSMGEYEQGIHGLHLSVGLGWKF